MMWTKTLWDNIRKIEKWNVSGIPEPLCPQKHWFVLFFVYCARPTVGIGTKNPTHKKKKL